MVLYVWLQVAIVDVNSGELYAGNYGLRENLCPTCSQEHQQSRGICRVVQKNQSKHTLDANKLHSYFEDSHRKVRKLS